MKQLIFFILILFSLVGGVNAETETIINTKGSGTFTQALDSGWAYSVTNTGTIAHEGYFSLVKVYITGTYDNGTIQIKKGSEIIASKYFDAAGSGLYPVTFSVSDYSQLLSAGDTYTITFIQGSPTESVYYYTSAYSGSYFSFSSQTTFGRGAQITYTAVDVLEVDYDKYINITSSQFNISTSYNTNIFYSLDNNSSINLCYNCVSYQLNLTGLSENWHDLDIITLNGSSELNASFNFSVDLTPPSINNSIPTEINSYQFLGTYFSCSDINLDYCNISINGQNKATGVSFTLNQSGNLSYTITAQDLAGNTATVNGVLFVNPYQYIDIYDYLRFVDVDNYYLGGVLMNENYIFKLYDYGVGTHNISFYKVGYLNQTITFTLSNTTVLNATYNVTAISLTIKVYDIETMTQIYFNLTITNSEILTYTNQFNFEKYYNETATGDLVIHVESSNYSNADYILTFSPNTVAELNAYLFPITSTMVHQFTILDQETGAVMPGVTLEVQEIINSSYTTLTSKITGDNGATYFYLDPTKEYKIIFSKDGYVTATANTIPSVVSYTFKMTSTVTTYEYVEDISYKITPITSLLQTNNTYNFSAFISGSSFSNVIFTITLSNGTQLYTSSTTNPTGSTFNYEYFINPNSNYSNIIVNLTYIKDGSINSLYKTYSVLRLNNDSFILTLQNYGKTTDEETQMTKWLILMVLTVSVLVAGNPLLIIPLWTLASFIGWADWVMSAVAMFVALVFFLGGRR